jgi:hypothetical protein
MDLLPLFSYYPLLIYPCKCIYFLFSPLNYCLILLLLLLLLSPWCTFFVQVYRDLKSCISLLENISLQVPTHNVRDSQSLVFVPLINTVLLLGAPMLPTWRVKIWTYLQSKPFLPIIFIPNLKLLIIFVHNPNDVCYLILGYHILTTSLHLCLFVYFFCINVFSSSSGCL